MIGLAGLLIGVVGGIWIAIIAFQNDDIAWGIISIFCGLAAIIYGIQHAEEARIPLFLIFIGFILGFASRIMALQT